MMKGFIAGISGLVAVVQVDSRVRMFEAVRIGGGTPEEARLLGEVVRIRGEEVDVQIHGDTAGLSVGEGVFFTGELLSVDLGPGFLGEVLDGTGRSLRKLAKRGIYLERRPEAPVCPDGRLWRFTPSVTEGGAVVPGDILGTVIEGSRFLHRILVPPALSSPEAVVWIAPEGDYASRDCICRLASGIELSLTQRWAVRVPRPVKASSPLDRPLMTAQRVLDTLFPMALGGVGAVPGGTGTGKTVLQRSLAKGCNGDVIVYIGCGGRGAEIAEFLEELSDGEKREIPLRERMVFVANTSNMPAAARDSGIHVGMTLAEYYRDMGYDVVVIVDSMSRWGETMREIGNRLEETPGEEGYPAYLGSRLSGYCERAGQVETLGASSRRGSVTLVNVFSPEGGDFSEPVTQAGLRPSGACWLLDGALAQARRFPAIDLKRSYSTYEDVVSPALIHDAGQDWAELKEYLRDTLWRERELSDSMRSSGGITLSEEDRWILFHAETLRITYVQQNASDAKDACSSPARWAAMLRILKALDDGVRKFLREGGRCDDAVGVSMRPKLAALRELSEDFTDKGWEWLELVFSELAAKRPSNREAAQ